jgi:hypothetical protein
MRKIWIAVLAGFVVAIFASGAEGQQAPATGALAAPAVSAPSPHGPKIDTYGTSHTSFQRIGLAEFLPADSSMTYSDTAFTSFTFSRFPTNVSGSGTFLATPHLPSGALVTDVEFDWCDTNAGSDLSFQVQSTTFTGETATVIAAASSTGSAGCDFTVATLISPFTIDNNENQLVLVAVVPTQDGTTSISGAIMRYTLQVSPAPATASFNDVPTSDFAFQYIEALFASGVTGGCGANPPFVPPVYCPDAFVTRRQMGIFISKALGLQWQ